MHAPIFFDSRWAGNHGIGRFAAQVQARLPGLQPLAIMGAKLGPLDPLAISLALAGKRAGLYFSPGFNPPLRSPIPFVFTVHDLVHLRVPQESTALRRLYYAGVVRPATRRAACVLTVSQYSRRDILAWSGLPPERVRVVGNGVATAFTPGPATAADAGGYLLHVGRRAGHKNVDRLLRAYAASRARAQLTLRFTGAPDAPTVTLARALGIEERIAFAGEVSDEALAGLYRGALALVFPSLHEGFGLPVVEAMACGTPVITADATSTAEIADAGSALLVDPLDTGALAEAIDRLAGDAGLRETLRTSGLLRAREFRWDAVAARVAAALGECA